MAPYFAVYAVRILILPLVKVWEVWIYAYLPLKLTPAESCGEADIMNSVPPAGATPAIASVGVPAVAVTPVHVFARNDGSAGGAVTADTPFLTFTVFTLTKHCAPVRLIVVPSELVTVKDCANAFQAARCASVRPRQAAL